MRIGIVCYPTPGGSGVVAAELGKSLAAKGHQVHFITHGLPSRLSQFEENIFFHKVDSAVYPLFGQFNPYSLSAAVKIREVAEKFELDVVHVHYAIPYATCAFLAKEMLKPRRLLTVTTLHGTDVTLVGMMPSFYEITKFSVEASDAVTAVSSFLRDQTLKAFSIRKPIRVIRNFVDCSEFKPRKNAGLRKKLAPRGERIMMHASNFRKVKNIPTIVNVFCKVKESLSSARLILIGDGPEREPTEKFCDRMGVGGDVVFMGDQEFVQDVLPLGDVFLLPSQHESFGLAALEAMSCGVPVVGTKVGGLEEVVEHGVSGYLMDPEDVDGMSEAVLGILGDERRRREMGMRARERARRDFGRDKGVEEYLDLYRELVGRSDG